MNAKPISGGAPPLLKNHLRLRIEPLQQGNEGSARVGRIESEAEIVAIIKKPIKNITRKDVDSRVIRCPV